jgi:hypothetical protein
VPAARLGRRTVGVTTSFERLRDANPGQPLRLGPDQQFVYNQDFHFDRG